MSGTPPQRDAEAEDAGPTRSIHGVTNTNLGAFNDYNRTRRQWAAPLAFADLGQTLPATTGVNTIVEQNRQMQEALAGPARVLHESVAAALQPVSVQFSNTLADALRPIIAQQSRLLTDMVRFSLPQGYLDTLGALERSGIGRIQKLSRLALGGPSFQAFRSLQLDWPQQVSGINHLLSALQAAGVAATADIAVPAEESIEQPEWLTDFAARVRALPATEQRALVLNLIGIALLITTTAVAWGATGGTAAWLSSGGLVTSVLTFANSITALYEDDEQPEDSEQ
ncbi:MAG: hypothetical protein QOE06_1415 [Thermoleophilaceae bacterium]|jgi:uncharacterized protein YukE|nr:hypothetical protein [Thermoleophilaceae bacterium]